MQHENADSHHQGQVSGRYRGREISLGEVQFVFDRVWTISCAQLDHDGDQGREHDKRDRIRITELFMIIELVGTLLNKAGPDESDTKPGEQWAKYVQVEHIEGNAQQFVHKDDMPSLLFNVFASQKDEMRMSLAQRILTYGDTDNKHIIDHVLDDIWAKYDYNGNGVLDTTPELYDLVKSILQENENANSQQLGQAAQAVTDEQIQSAIRDCKTTVPGQVTREELSEWMISYVK